jgi:HEAT repeat protein/beta-lactamase regulating signal transducer with metallopeptidase domain
MMPADVDVVAAAVLSWLLTYAIHSTILLAGAALVARRFADQHAWLDAIWKVALIAPMVTASLHLGPSVIALEGNAVRPAASQTRTEKSAAVEPVTGAPAVEAPVETASTVAPAGTGSRSWQPALPSWPSMAVLAWLLIAAAGLARYGVRLRRFHRSVRSGPPVSMPGVLDMLRELTHAAREARSIALTASDACAVPIALAGRHIVVPARFLDQLDPDQQRAALAHELAHVIRRDSMWRIVAAAIERALFFQPLTRVARVKMTESAEFLCDQWAVQQTGSPLALARCLERVASWATAANDNVAVGASAMARSDSAMVRRVRQILDQPAPPAPRPRLIWLVAAVALFAVAAPRVTAQRQEPGREWTAADIARAQSNLRVYRPVTPNDSLDNRWRWALAEARRQRFAEFWVAYSFETPVHAGDLVITDSGGTSFVSSGGWIESFGPPLRDVLRDGGGNIVALFHYRGASDAAIDRASFRSASVGFNFERQPVFWLGFADESQSFARVRDLYEQTRGEEMRLMVIELASMHGNSNVVIPFLERLVDLSQPSAVRNEAAEGFGHHHDPRSVEILLRVARTDPITEVRAEAAETIGEVQTPQSIPALHELVDRSDDPDVRQEAAEAFADQPPAEAFPALERVIAGSPDEEVVAEAIEALGELDGVRVLDALVRTANSHASRNARQEAVETLGDIDDAGAVDALVRIIREHSDEDVVDEAIETLSDLSGEALHPEVLALAASGKTPRLRRNALEAIGDAIAESGNAQLLDRAEQVLERAIFDDPDRSVQMEALDALEKLTRDREERLLRQVIDRHPDSRIRREAEEHLRERRQ